MHLSNMLALQTLDGRNCHRLKSGNLDDLKRALKAKCLSCTPRMFDTGHWRSYD
jgi:hypothetical protein